MPCCKSSPPTGIPPSVLPGGETTCRFLYSRYFRAIRIAAARSRLSESQRTARRREMLRLRSNQIPAWDNRVFRDDDDPISHHPILVIQLGAAWQGADHNSGPEAHIFVEDGALDVTIFANPQADSVRSIIAALVEIGAHEDRIGDAGPVGDVAAQADNRVADLGFLDAAAIGP